MGHEQSSTPSTDDHNVETISTENLRLNVSKIQCPPLFSCGQVETDRNLVFAYMKHHFAEHHKCSQRKRNKASIFFGLIAVHQFEALNVLTDDTKTDRQFRNICHLVWRYAAPQPVSPPSSGEINHELMDKLCNELHDDLVKMAFMITPAPPPPSPSNRVKAPGFYNQPEYIQDPHESIQLEFVQKDAAWWVSPEYSPEFPEHAMLTFQD
mmetsp:Transcript_21899/g.35162  ORF Transcript_21899/g.35162 Transcript_21899/m.35162 type:complete len:210 (-) Transcript_21899:216-845(-)|eukprot:CAMPEP_0197022150 /NCGR_PEP_ID=MMETSP1384-20130603/3052_1 /TAXON_ID=29189 /ORGANISM="Ammonia sp." /LENGTH=209 /DNA_ID=CAMNT_0042450125 /DNA_START=71 /DNA_END=700 /DNA_ORIENTATION=+